MSDEEESMSEGFSASEDEWKPSKDIKGGESSDDDDSDFDGSALTGAASGGSGTSTGRKRIEPKARSAARQTSSKKRTGLSLRTKLYNKYRPPPKTMSPTISAAGKNSPTASTSRSNSKKTTASKDSKYINPKTKDGEDSGSSSDSSIGNYLVNFDDLDLQSSFFKVDSKPWKVSSASPTPTFDCNAGLENLSDSASEEEKNQQKNNEKTFDFNNLLEYAKNVERLKESVAKHNAEEAKKKASAKKNIDSLDVYSVLALGEKLHNRSHNDGEDEDDEDDDGISNNTQKGKNLPAKLSKTKSTRVKRHTKTRPSSTVAASDTDDSDWEEVPDVSQCTATSSDVSRTDCLEIHVELPSRNREKQTKTQQDVELALKRRLNRNIKERQILLHKTSLLCRFGRIFFYNRLLNNTTLMQKALKLLPSKAAYPPDRGTEIKYFQSMVTWFKSFFKLKSQNLYPENSASKTKSKAFSELEEQIEKKEARCKQDMIFIFIILLRAMGLQCRLVVNMQPLPLKPAQSELLTIKMKKDDESGTRKLPENNNSKSNESGSDSKTDAELKPSSSNPKGSKQRATLKETQIKATKKPLKNSPKEANPAQTNVISENSKSHTKSLKKSEFSEKDTDNEKKKVTISGENNKNENAPKNLKQKRSFAKCHKEETNPSSISAAQAKSTKLTKQGNMRNNSKTIEKDANPFSSHKNKVFLKPENEQPENDLSESTSNNMEITETEAVTIKKVESSPEGKENSQKENQKDDHKKQTLSRLKRAKKRENGEEVERKANKKTIIESGSTVVPKIVVHSGNAKNTTELPSCSRQTRNTRSRSKSPKTHISTAFLLRSANCNEKFPGIKPQNTNIKIKNARGKSPAEKVKISTDFLTSSSPPSKNKRVLRSRQKTNEVQPDDSKTILLPQLDGADDVSDMSEKKDFKLRNTKKKQPNLKKMKVQSSENSDEDFEPLPSKKPKVAPALSKSSRRVVSSDEENGKGDSEAGTEKRKPTAGDKWVEVWCDIEEQWVCVDIFKGKIHCVDSIRKSASPSLAYVFAFQNDLSIKDVTARYCSNWATVVRKSRVDNAWLDAAISKYLGRRSKRDIKEDQELRRIHEEKPMPAAISEYKNHPFYALERHLLKFEALYPPDAPALGYVRGEPVYSRDCVHTLHSREIWLKQARTVKLGEKPYKIVKARPKWDRITKTVIKDQPLEIFGFWQTQEYDPPTAENGIVPRNAYGNVELFKMSMLPKKTKHIRLPGLNRICKKLGVDCANAVVGFDFHQGACHPTYDGFVVCEEFEDQVVAAWHQDQEEQERKEREKYETRVYGNWKKLIRGLLIRERLKLKYNL